MSTTRVSSKTHRQVLFWIRSSRGTDSKVAYIVSKKMTKDQIKSKLVDWCSKHTCWGISDNYIQYGWKYLRWQNISTIRSKYKTIVKRYRAIEEKYKIYRSLINLDELKY